MADRLCTFMFVILFLAGGISATYGASGASELLMVNAMSFNIRYGTADDGPDAWPKRREALLEWLASRRPGVLGVQEALHFQIEEIAAALPEYVRAGVGRDDGVEKGEYSAVFIDRRRYELLESDTFWFSETPGTPGSTSWGNYITRICTWVSVRDRETGSQFYVYNLHLDHQSQPSRERSVELLLERIAARKFQDAQVIIMGDFNSGESNPAIAALRDAGYIDTFRAVHPDETVVGTFNGFEGKVNGEKIDYIFINAEEGWTVRDAEIHRDKTPQGRNLSDHFAISTDLVLEVD